MLSAAGCAFFEQSRAQPNIYLTVICLVVFMAGMMRLSSKLPSKNPHKEDDYVE